MIIDFHTHCFPDKLAPRAIASLSRASGLIPENDGTQKSLAATAADRCVVLSIATNPHQQKAVNDFAISIKSEKLIPFGSVHPAAKDALFELERIHAAGLRGVKLHPEYQGFYPDDSCMIPIYKKISDLGLILVFHAGADYGYLPPYHATPNRLLFVLRYTDAPVVAAHMGGLAMPDDVLHTLAGQNIYFDTAFSYGSGSVPMYKKIIEAHGCQKILFGTDSPWHSVHHELHWLGALGLTEEEQAKILYKNAQKLLA